MKNLTATAVIAALLSVGTIATSSAAAVMSAPVSAESSTQIHTVDWRGRAHERHDGQWRHHRRSEIMPPRAIVRSLRHQGYRDIGRMTLSRGDYTVHARGHRGQVRLVVDGRTGRILGRDLLRRGHHDGRGHRNSRINFGGNNGNFSYQFSIR